MKDGTDGYATQVAKAFFECDESVAIETMEEYLGIFEDTD